MIAIAHARGLRSLERLGLYENRKIGDEGCARWCAGWTNTSRSC